MFHYEIKEENITHKWPIQGKYGLTQENPPFMHCNSVLLIMLENTLKPIKGGLLRQAHKYT